MTTRRKSNAGPAGTGAVSNRATLRRNPAKSAVAAVPTQQQAPSEVSCSIVKAQTVLLAVTGMSPAVVTETIWALAHENPPIIPARVVVVTTAEGRRELCRQLLEPQEALGGIAAWDALRADLARLGHDVSNRLVFGETGSDICVFTSLDPKTGRSRELTDIRTREDSDVAANFLLEKVRTFAANPDIQLTASLAGGRKTMGALLYACMTLSARESDRLTHVLVSEPYDAMRGFFYPGQPGVPLKDRDGRIRDASQAQVSLADVPFVALRNLFQKELRRPVGDFGTLVRDCRERVSREVGATLKVTIDPARRRVEVNGSEVSLSSREMLVLLFLANRAKERSPAIRAYKDAIKPIEEYRLQVCAKASKSDFNDWRASDGFDQKFFGAAPGDEEPVLRRIIADIRKKLRSGDSETIKLADCLPEKGRFGLLMPGEMLFVKGF